VGWRTTYLGVGIFCTAAMLLLALALRRRARRWTCPFRCKTRSLVSAPWAVVQCAHGSASHRRRRLLHGDGDVDAQVHIMAYCGDLGYGAARSAELLSLMLGFGVIRRLASG
jgi:hypothetical protein